MGLLQKAHVEQAAAKVGIFSGQGGGKTTTAILMAIGLSKTFHESAPIAFFDTENGSDYVIPICEAEGVPLLVVKSRAFKDMRQSLSEAEAEGACVFIPDSYTHPWKELTDTFKAKSRRKKLEFHHMDELKSEWQKWTDQMLNSPLHCIMAGRLGYNWDREEDDENGERGDLIKLGTKMKGESEAGYEPSLLIELEAIQSAEGRVKKTRAKKSTIVHHAYVLKDRWRTLNGRTFQFADLNTYKPGDYKKVFEAFRPHFDKLVIGGAQRAVSPTRNSASMFDGQDTSEFGRRRTIALEEIQGITASIWPGQTAGEKAARQLIMQALFQTRSWSKVETLKAEALEAAVKTLTEFESQAKSNRDLIDGEAAILALLQFSKDIVDRAAEEDNTPDAVEEPVL